MRLSPSRIIAVTLAVSVAFAATPVVATAAASEGSGAHSFEEAAKTAQEQGRKIATDLIGLGFAIASIVLAFRRDFKEAAGVFAIGLVALFLSMGTGVEVLKKTVEILFGG